MGLGDAGRADLTPCVKNSPKKERKKERIISFTCTQSQIRDAAELVSNY